eukprot:1135952-Amphidinium_carterae.1
MKGTLKPRSHATKCIRLDGISRPLPCTRRGGFSTSLCERQVEQQGVGCQGALSDDSDLIPCSHKSSDVRHCPMAPDLPRRQVQGAKRIQDLREQVVKVRVWEKTRRKNAIFRKVCRSPQREFNKKKPDEWMKGPLKDDKNE